MNNIKDMNYIEDIKDDCLYVISRKHPVWNSAGKMDYLLGTIHKGYDIKHKLNGWEGQIGLQRFAIKRKNPTYGDDAFRYLSINCFSYLGKIYNVS